VWKLESGAAPTTQERGQREVGERKENPTIAKPCRKSVVSDVAIAKEICLSHFLDACMHACLLAKRCERTDSIDFVF
jgi:hypothetical protein